MYKQSLPLLLAGASSALAALQVDFDSASSIRAAAKDVAFDVMSYYKGNRTGEILGLLDSPPPNGDYFWWTNAIVWSTLIDYWRYTGDTTYNDVTAEALLAQSGPDLDHAFLPPNYTVSIGNDDHGFWALAAMQAAELDLPSPSEDEPSWINLAKAVFEMQAARYSIEEDGECEGGLRWMLAPVSSGYDVKNTVSTAVFLNLGTRLYRFTDNETYADWAEKSWDWLTSVGLIDDEFNVYDSVNVNDDCETVSSLQWSYALGVLLEAAAYMSNHTGESNNHRHKQKVWSERVTSLASRAMAHFFPDGTLVERACENTTSDCNGDIHWQKGITLRSLATAATLVPELRTNGDDGDRSVAAALRTTVESAVATCDGGLRGRECGYRWAGEVVEGEEVKTTGPPSEVNALAALVVALGAQNGWSELAGSENGESGNGDSNGDSNGGSNGGEAVDDGEDEGNAGVSTRAGMGLMLVGLVAALL
ncbi:glycoside hydrolase [Corynascus novoguineensis]|uniref:Mannan endo-1,6-alpha-mannosidase n=1 Tax=Corynascus novoguineensis TaxID=1126955 RepID=A0AAN7CZN6_9PEZI|nr:glycoside hydrolase [Corynascus novoguineensis]